MGLKQFNEDVALADNASIHRVSRIRRGDSDGEVVFDYTQTQDSSALEIQVLILDVDSYPKCSEFMIFTASEYPGEDLSPFLEQLSGCIGRKNINAMITTISEKLACRLESSSITIEGLDIETYSQSEDDSYDFAVDDFGELNGQSYVENPQQVPQSGHHLTVSAARRLKKDLRAAQAAGFTIGIFPKLTVLQAECFSLSLRVNKLGIPGDALEAWDLKASEYIVLLCRFPLGCPTLSEILAWNNDEMSSQFRFGKCAKSRPSIKSARLAFAKSVEKSTHAVGDTPDKSDFDEQSDNFLPLYMSNSINMLLNKEFFRLLRIRRNDGLSWDAALSSSVRIERGKHRPNTSPSQSQRDDSISNSSDAPISTSAHESLRHDYAEDPEVEFSTPLVVMQFALRRLALCTKYCMVCHERMDDGFEALKPYVCSNSLCLYQYITLELGSSIEHEIIRNPYVVDILISFFCAAIAHQALREYPKGLNLKGIHAGTTNAPAEHLEAEVCFKERNFRFKLNDYTKCRSVKVGDSVLVVLHDQFNARAVSILNSSLERHFCRITAIENGLYTFTITSTETMPTNVMQLPEDERPTRAANENFEWVKAMLFQFNKDVDDLSDSDRCVALGLITSSIPSVLKMRAYLVQNPGKRLSSWEHIDKNSYTLLHWIIASNRSLILQDGAVPTVLEAMKGSGDDDLTSTNHNKVTGLPHGWMQFRFLQGTPERERLFFQRLQAMTNSRGDQAHFPTIFAWHGSRLQNWHSIIRTGLDFSTILNGRACGNGVYFSSKFDVSNGYSGGQSTYGNRVQWKTSLASSWRNSQLRPCSAISLCEIINRPLEFVCRDPHYVVDKIEWIQCRYLFVDVTPTLEAEQYLLPAPQTTHSSGYIEQSNQFQLSGHNNGNVRIPLSGLPSNRRHISATSSQKVETTTTDEEPAEPDPPSESIESDDCNSHHELLMESDEELEESSSISRKRPRSISHSSFSSGSSKLDTAARLLKISKDPSTNVVKTDFRPGSLDLQSLPRLPEPSWASSSPLALKGLNRAIKELQKIQSDEDIGSLGWYVDFDNLNNVYQWIAELHTFDDELPLAKDMKKIGCTSIALELRFGSNFPYSPPFVRVVRPKLLPFGRGGGGHVTIGGAICSELLTNTGWSPVMTLDKVLLQVRLGLSELDPPARLENTGSHFSCQDYAFGEAIDGYRRAAIAHGWHIPDDIKNISAV